MKHEAQKKDILVSGAKPSGVIHIGNYLGAIRQWAEMQETHHAFVFLADLHALTEPQDPKALREQVLSSAADFIAFGIDPKRSTLFLQSRVPEHTALMWVLATITAMGDLERMVAYKEKRAEGKEALAGLFSYPVLMAADILLYKPSVVPVGEDQRQHVELTRELARRFNTRFGETFPLPKPVFPDAGARVMSLQDPTKKMSKSHAPASYITLSDSPAEIRKKIQTAVTDSGTSIAYEPETRPGLANLITIYHLFSDMPRDDIEKEFSGKGYKEFKEALAELIIEKLRPMQEKRQELLNNPKALNNVLEEGSAQARAVASRTLTEVYEKVGLG